MQRPGNYCRPILMLLVGAMFSLPTIGASVEHVIQISVDGLRADAVTTLGAANLPNFYRLRSEGAFTDNARTDADHTNTLPNHSTQLTGRGVDGASGHNYTSNGTPGAGVTLHSNKGSYVASVFDVAHDNGLSTGLFASKSKFSIFDVSYNAAGGATDVTGIDNGKAKIDDYTYVSDTGDLVDDYLLSMSAAPFNYSLLHLRDPDSAGHGSTWSLSAGSGYLNSIVTIDGLLGQVLGAIDADADLSGKTAIILTADHGGRLGTGTHSPASDDENFTIPFYVWGPGVAAGADLYTLNLFSRTDPGTTQPGYTDPDTAIRNGDAANLALDLLGLGAVPGSTINAAQDLSTAPVPLPATLPLLFVAAAGLRMFAGKS